MLPSFSGPSLLFPILILLDFATGLLPVCLWPKASLRGSSNGVSLPMGLMRWQAWFRISDSA